MTGILNDSELIEVTETVFDSSLSKYAFLSLDKDSAERYQRVLSANGYNVEISGPSLDCSVLKDKELFSVSVFRRAA